MTNQKTILTALGIATIILIGVMVYFARTNKENQPSQTPLPQFSPTPEDQPSDQSTANQPPITPTAMPKNSFTNPSGKYGFEIPSDWKATTNNYNGNNSLFGPEADGSSGLGGVEVFENQISIETFLENIDVQYSNKTKITVDGISGIRIHYKGFPTSGEQSVLLKNDKIYNIYINSANTEDIELFEQILTTFEFME